MRDYPGMNPDKRRECIESLRAGCGDAYDTCVQRGGDPAAHLLAARKRGARKERPNTTNPLKGDTFATAVSHLLARSCIPGARR